MENDFKCPREGDLDELKADVKAIMDNHLPTMDKKITRMDEAIGKLGNKFAYQAGILAVVLILMSVILAYVLGVI